MTLVHISFAKDHGFSTPRIFTRIQALLNLIDDIWLAAVVDRIRQAGLVSNVKFNRNFKLIGTSSREDRSLFWQLPMVLMQSRITSRPSVKVFNGSSPYRRAIFVRERARARTGEKVSAGIRGGGRRNGGAEPLFFYFGLSTSPEKIASLKRIRLGFHNGRVPNPVYPPTTIPAFLPHFHPHPPNVSAAFGMYGESVVLTLGALINF